MEPDPYALGFAEALIEQDTTRIRRRVRSRSLEDAYFGAVEILIRGALHPDHALPDGESSEAVLAKAEAVTA